MSFGPLLTRAQRVALRLVVASLVLGTASAAKAQVAASLSAEGAGGVAFTRGGLFDSRWTVDARYAIDFRIGRRTGPRVFLGVERDWLRINLLKYASCTSTGTGQCWDPFPSLAGSSALVGIVVGSTPTREIRFAGGSGWYTPVYGVGDVRGRIAQVDWTRFYSYGVGTNLGVRALSFPTYRTGDLWTYVLVGGLRWRTGI